MEILEYNIRGYGKQPFVGILLCKGSKWIVFADNTVDYVIDGISLVNAHYYKECSSVESESTLFKVLSYKGKKSDVLRIKTSSIRMLEIRTDYLESLSYIIGTELL